MSRPDPSPDRAQRAIDGLLWFTSFLTLGLILWLSLAQDPPGVDAFPAADKVWHALAYAIVTGCWLFAGVWRPVRGAGRFPQAMMAVVAGFAVLGALVEIVQHWFDRAADPLDWLADVVGVMVAFLAWNTLRSRSVEPGRS